MHMRCSGLQASLRVSLTMTPIPSNTLWRGALHMNAQVVINLFFLSTWAFSTSVFTCLQPMAFRASAVWAYGHLMMTIKSQLCTMTELQQVSDIWWQENSHVSLCVLAHSELAAGQQFGGEDGWDAAHAQWLSSSMKTLDDPLYVGMNGAVLVLHSPVAKVLCHAEATCTKAECQGIHRKELLPAGSV